MFKGAYPSQLNNIFENSTTKPVSLVQRTYLIFKMECTTYIRGVCWYFLIWQKGAFAILLAMTNVPRVITRARYALRGHCLRRHTDRCDYFTKSAPSTTD